MADFALTLPDHDLTANEFKELARRVGRAAFVPLFVRFYERVMTSEASIEEQRKALSDIARWVGVEEEKKIDPNANLPVFNIVFGAPTSGHGGSMEVVEVMPAEVSTAPPPALEPQELAIIQNIVRAPHVQENERASPSAVLGAVGADAPRKRRRKRDEGQRPQALQPAQGADASAPLAQDGASAQAPRAHLEEVARADSFEDALASLDDALGL